MRKCVFLLMAIVMISVTGCDFFRAVAGRPTSKDIETKRMEIIRAEEASLQARLDSIAQAEAAARAKVLQDQADSTAALEYMLDNRVSLIEMGRLGGIVSDGVEAFDTEGRYRIIVGSFRDRRNAVTQCNIFADAGDFQSHLITFGNGMIAVAVCPVSRIQDAVLGLKQLKTHPECPSDVWILKCE